MQVGKNFCALSGMAHPTLTLQRVKDYCQKKTPCIMTSEKGQLKHLTLAPETEQERRVYGILRDNPTAANRRLYTSELAKRRDLQICTIAQSNELEKQKITFPFKAEDVILDILKTSDSNAITYLSLLYDDTQSSVKTIRAGTEFK